MRAHRHAAGVAAASRDVSGILHEVADDPAPWEPIGDLLLAPPPTESELLVHRALGFRQAITRPLGLDRASPLSSMVADDPGGELSPAPETPDIAKLHEALKSFLDTLDNPGPLPLGNLTPEADAWMDGLIDIFAVAAAATTFELAPGTVVGRLVDGLRESAKPWQRARSCWEHHRLADGLRALAALFSEDASSQYPSPVTLTALVSVGTGFLEEAKRQDHHIRGTLTIAQDRAHLGAAAPRLKFIGSPARKEPHARKEPGPLPPGPDQFMAAMTKLEGQLGALDGEMSHAAGARRAELARTTSDALQALADIVPISVTLQGTGR